MKPSTAVRGKGGLLLASVLLVWHALTSGVAAASGPPPSFVLLPLSSFANASLVAPYNCAPVWAYHPCNGHGDCLLLLDSTAAYAQPFLEDSNARPMPAFDTPLDTKNIDVNTALPAAVCVCHAGYTGRGDYINHYAMDGDSCGIYKPAVDAISGLTIAEFVFVLLLALHRLYRWWLWHAASVADSASLYCAAAGEPVSRHSTDSANNNQNSSKNSNSTEANAAPPTSSPLTQIRSTNRAVDGLPTTAAITPVGRSPSPVLAPLPPIRLTRSHHRTATYGGPVRLNPRAGADGSTVIIAKTKTQKRQLLHRHLSHIAFQYPLLCVAVAFISIAYFFIRVATDWTVGSAYEMCCLTYVQHVPFMLACSLAVLNTLRAASAITRTATGVKGLSNVNRWARRCMIGLFVYSSLVSLLVFLVRAYPDQQQLWAQLNFCLCYTPISILGLVSVVATRRITNSLVQHLDMLSPQQRQDRLDVCRKLRRQSNVLAFLLVGNTILSFVLSLQPHIRQLGVPYYALLNHTFTGVILITRLLILRPQQAKHSVAPAPVLLTSPTPLNRLVTGSDVRLESRGSLRAQAAAGGSGAVGGVEVSGLERSPSRAWGRTLSGKRTDSADPLVGSEQSSQTRAGSETVHMQSAQQQRHST